MEQNIPLWVVTGIVVLANLYLAISGRIQSKGKESGHVETDMHCIKKTLIRIETRFDGELSKLENRLEQLTRQYSDLMSKSAKGEESLQLAHKRIDNLEHN